MAEELKNGIWVRLTNDVKLSETLIFLPTAIAGGAILYDVGYISSADISFYSIFSLQEHIVSALESIPYVLLLAVLMIFISVLAKIIRATYRVKPLDYPTNRILVYATAGSVVPLILGVTIVKHNGLAGIGIVFCLWALSELYMLSEVTRMLMA